MHADGTRINRRAIAAEESGRYLAVLASFTLCLGCYAAFPKRADKQGHNETIAIIQASAIGAPGEFGCAELEASMRQRDVEIQRATDPAKAPQGALLLVGIPDRDVRLHDLVGSGRILVPPNPESYILRRLEVAGRPTLVVAGSDERGVMYALLEIARRIRHLDPGTTVMSALSEMPEETARPAVQVRGMVQFLHSAALEKSWYYDRRYWESYLGVLAEDRFNSFNLVFAHQTSYLAPPYPFLFTVEKYPQVRSPGLTQADQRRNLETLQMISRLARERGIDFIMGIWEQRAWKRGQQSMVEGLTDDVLVDYARLAMEKLLRLCPDISGIQLRVNPESGIDNERQAEFYRDGIIAGMKAAGRPVLLDLRGWGALPETIQAVTQSGLPMRLSMKYWAEFMGMPYEPAQMLPSYSYADFLRYPRLCPVMYQVWSLGSHRLLPWGSVDWMQRFVPSTRLGDAIGFETCAPLSQKGFGNPPGDWRILVSPEREYYRWEFQRYWLYYLLYGRLSYDPETPEDIWMHEFRSHYGQKAAAAVFEAFQRAGEVIPFLVSYRLSDPNMYIWPEKQMGGVLDFYIEVKPADTARFATFQEYVAERLQGIRTAKMLPEEASRRLAAMAEGIERALAKADATLSPGENKEYAANRIDLMVLALLARYHSRKILAGAGLSLFYATGDESTLQSAESHAAAGLEIWERLVQLTDGIYYPRMIFGPQDVGHWKDNLVFVRYDVDRLKEVRTLFERYGPFELGLDFGPKVLQRGSAYEPQYANSYSIERRFRLLDPDMTYSRERGYGWREATGIRSSDQVRIPYSSLEGDNLDDLALPSGVLYKDFLRASQSSTLLVDLPDGNYRITSIVGDTPELAGGSFQIRAPRADAQAAHISYRAGESGDKSMDVTLKGGRLALDFVPEPGKDWLVSGLLITRHAPHIAHVPLRPAAPGSRTNVVVTITAPEGVKFASIQETIPSQVKPISIDLQPEGRQFSAVLDWRSEWNNRDVLYHIIAFDAAGNVSRLPGSGEFSVPVGDHPSPPIVDHTPVRSCRSGEPLHLSFDIKNTTDLVIARLHYRHLTQMEQYKTVDLVKSTGKYQATIPGEYINANYDLVYYVEAVDRFGSGTFCPNPDRTAPYVIVRVIH